MGTDAMIARMTSRAAITPYHLDWPDLYNARDLGGTPTVAGGSLRHRALIRSDQHSALTEAGIAAVHAAEVSRIVDLRASVECREKPSPFAHTPMYVNAPVEDPVGPQPDDGLSVVEIYQRMLDRRPELFSAAVVAVAEAPPGAVAIHCAAGKDRTGVVVALVLALAGGEPDAIAADYALTQERLAEPSARFLERISDPAERERATEFFATKPETMLAVLDHLDARHGGVQSYLTGGGCTDEHFAAIRQRLIS
jgi:protein tyrosine/serine phosphatase